RDLGHNGIRDRVHHLGSGFDDATPFGVAAYHEAVDVMEEDEWYKILVAVHDEAGGFLGGLGVNHTAELYALVAFVVGLLRVQFLIGYDADRESADTGVAANQGLAVLGLVFIEAAFVHYARQNFLHVIRARWRG